MSSSQGIYDDGMRVALIGVGFHGPLFPLVLDHAGHGSKIIALVDTNPDALQKAASELGIPAEQCFPSVEAFLAWKQVDAAIVSTPATVRQPVIDCLDAGLHVFCENPLALDYETARSAHKAARDLQRILVVDEQWQRLQSVQFMQQRMREDNLQLGELRRIKIFGKGRSGWTEVTRIGTHLLGVAQALLSQHCYRFVECSAQAMRGGKFVDMCSSGEEPDDVRFCLSTERYAGVRIIGEFFKEERPDVRKCGILFEFTRGRLLALGGLLEQVLYSDAPYDTGSSLQFRWQKLYPKENDIDRGAWAIIQPGMEPQVLRDPKMNPTFALWEEFEELYSRMRRGYRTDFTDFSKALWRQEYVAAACEAVKDSINANGAYVSCKGIN